MSDYGKNKKQICFDSIARLHAELKISLHYDEIKIREFFNEIIKAYVDKNEHIISFVEELKEKKKISLLKRNKTKQIHKQGQDTIKRFGLDESDIENIFDILEKEYTKYE